MCVWHAPSVTKIQEIQRRKISQKLTYPRLLIAVEAPLEGEMRDHNKRICAITKVKHDTSITLCNGQCDVASNCLLYRSSKCTSERNPEYCVTLACSPIGVEVVVVRTKGKECSSGLSSHQWEEALHDDPSNALKETRGSQTPTCLKESMKLHWHFQWDGGVQIKNFHEGSGYFLEQHSPFSCWSAELQELRCPQFADSNPENPEGNFLFNL